MVFAPSFSSWDNVVFDFSGSVMRRTLLNEESSRKRSECWNVCTRGDVRNVLLKRRDAEHARCASRLDGWAQVRIIVSVNLCEHVYVCNCWMCLCLCLCQCVFGKRCLDEQRWQARWFDCAIGVNIVKCKTKLKKKSQQQQIVSYPDSDPRSCITIAYLCTSIYSKILFSVRLRHFG